MAVKYTSPITHTLVLTFFRRWSDGFEFTYRSYIIFGLALQGFLAFIDSRNLAGAYILSVFRFYIYNLDKNVHLLDTKPDMGKHPNFNADLKLG